MANDPMLLNYMYQKGYTEEDMYDEGVVTKVASYPGFVVWKLKKAVMKVFYKIRDIFKTVWAQIKPYVLALKEQKKNVRAMPIQLPAIASKPLIQHQVLDRKPRYLYGKPFNKE